MALGLIFGTLLAAMKMCRIKILKTDCQPVYNIYQVYAGDCTDLSRPYGLPVLFGLAGIDYQWCQQNCVFNHSIDNVCIRYIVEIIRPAYLSVDKGADGAALMSALTPAQAIRLIILPQVVYVALPNFATCSLP